MKRISNQSMLNSQNSQIIMSNIISVYLKVVKHQGSVFSPLLFGFVMDVVTSEVRSGIPSELLYADDLVLMVMVCSSDRNITLSSGK